MSDALDIIVKKMNNFGKTLSKKSNIYFKKAVHKSEEYTNKGMKQIEIEKLKWKLKRAYSELGQYIYKNNIKNNVVDYSDDEKFILLINRINKIRNFINQRLSS